MGTNYYIAKMSWQHWEKEYINKDFNIAYCELDCWIYLLNLHEDPVEPLLTSSSL